jgi:hypothetical protein
MAVLAMTPLALADTPGASSTSPQPVMLSDRQLDQVVGGHLCDNFSINGNNIIVGGFFVDADDGGKLLQVFTVPEGDGSIHCALKPNGGVPIVIFTGHNGTGQIVVIGDQGGAR